jgi:hypothetical protein
MLSIRSMKPDVYCEKVKDYRMKPLLYDVATKNKFLSDFFDASHYKAITKEMIFDNINTFKTESNDLLLSLIFLTNKDKEKAKKAYLDLDKNFNINSVVYMSGAPMLRKSKFVDILVYYVNLISLFCVTYISALSDDKQDCIHEMSENFKFEYQITLINNWLERYANQEYINVDDFFDNEYMQFANDASIREGLCCLYYEILTQNPHK